jgi:hypothetical protein
VYKHSMISMVLCLLLTSCMSEREACLTDLQLSTQSAHCGWIFLSMQERDRYLQSGELEKAARAEQSIELFTLLCAKYLADESECKTKSRIVPVPRL